MQSHPGAARTICKTRSRGDKSRLGISSFCGLGSEKPVLLGPVERQVELGQTHRGKLDRLPALQDCLDQLWAQEGQTNKTPYITPADAVAFGQLLQRSRSAGDQLLKPRAPACNRLDQRQIASRRMVVLCVEQENKPGPDTAPLDADGRGQLDSAVAGCIQCGRRWSANSGPRRTLMMIVCSSTIRLERCSLVRPVW